MSATEKRAHTVSPYRYALDEVLAVLREAVTRSPAPQRETMELGESAQKVPYIKSLVTHRGEDEGWKPWLDRQLEMFNYVRAQLVPPDTLAEDLKKSVKNPKGMSDKVPF